MQSCNFYHPDLILRILIEVENVAKLGYIRLVRKNYIFTFAQSKIKY